MLKHFKRLIGSKILISLSPLFDDETYLKLMYRIRIGKKLDLDNCQTLNEKLQWLKLNNRHHELTENVDKIKVKPNVASKIGDKYIIPTLKVWNSPAELTADSFNDLPDSFVIKTNHGGGNTGVFVVKDKKSVNIKKLKRKLARSFRNSLYNDFREWAYKDVDKKIFAEVMIDDNPVDYKFYCFNGNVDSVMLCLDRQDTGKPKYYFFDKDWNLKRYNIAGKNAPENFTLPKPEAMDKMFEIASVLSKGAPFVRVDLYNVNGKIYFGELTYTPAGGYDWNRLPETDKYFGNMIDLSLAKIEK